MGAFEEKFQNLTRAQRNAMNVVAFRNELFNVQPSWATLQSLKKLGLIEFRFPAQWAVPSYVFDEWVVFTKRAAACAA